MKFPQGIVAEALDTYIASITEEREADGKYHPSSMFMCDRSTILGVRGVEATNKPDAQTKRVFKIGNLYHELVQQAIDSHFLVAWSEFGVDIPELNIAGHGDVLGEIGTRVGTQGLRERDGYWVVEVKSTKSLRYTPKEDHRKQGSVYAVAARDFGVLVTAGDEEILLEPLGDQLKGLILVYLNKNDLEVKEYVYPYDPKWRKDIEAKVKKLDKYRLYAGHTAIEKVLPPPMPLDKGKPSWYHTYCPYRGSGLCCGDKEEDMEW